MEVYGFVDKSHVSREKVKARELRKTNWWKQKLAQGVCNYCQGKFLKEDLTMDHVVPISRGGCSTKGNVVASCKSCNSQKKYHTPAELILMQNMYKD